MYKINGTTITLTKGDSFYCQLTLTKDGETYTPEAEDVIRFGMKKEYTDAEAVVTTVIPNDTRNCKRICTHHIHKKLWSAL
ncbi:MAG: hypothetical protein IIY21_00780 [Clostridiales bacterium]|nr:hypothetical protein [Clostridiales bacterium]MBQ1571425.1 hypothetical protein [Clostridiales bacterium]